MAKDIILMMMNEPVVQMNFDEGKFDVLNKTSLTIVTYAHYVDDPSRQLMFIMNASQKTGNAYSVYFKNGKEVHFDLMPADIRVFEL